MSRSWKRLFSDIELFHIFRSRLKNTHHLKKLRIAHTFTWNTLSWEKLLQHSEYFYQACCDALSESALNSLKYIDIISWLFLILATDASHYSNMLTKLTLTVIIICIILKYIRVLSALSRNVRARKLKRSAWTGWMQWSITPLITSKLRNNFHRTEPASKGK